MSISDLFVNCKDDVLDISKIEHTIECVPNDSNDKYTPFPFIVLRVDMNKLNIDHLVPN